MKLTAPLTELAGVGPRTAEEFAKAGIGTVGELLAVVPSSYDMPQAPVPIADLTEGETAAVRGEILSSPVTRHFGGQTATSFSVGDGSGRLTVWFFRMPYIKNTIARGADRVLRGRVSRGRNGFQMAHPALYAPEEYERTAGTILPVYPLSGKITQAKMRKLMRQALAEAEAPADLLSPDTLACLSPEAAALSGREALLAVHFPKDRTQLKAGRERLVFEEFLLFVLRLRLLRRNAEQEGNPCPMHRHELTDAVRAALPYRLTVAQEKVLSEILADLGGPHGMNRLIQGDVGSGKTVLAFLSMTAAYENGYQAALMAPTEVLARQHFEKLDALIREKDLPMRAVLLTGSQTAAEKRRLRERIREGREADLVIGTHALIQDGVAFARPGLVITDEQHRFGVRQREHLAALGGEPHVLVMSATPIPRTLAMILYGDLDVSVLNELPAGRRPVETAAVTPAARKSAWKLLLTEAQAGRQSYVICPQIAPSDESDQENVTEYAEKLRKALPADIPVGILHGKMKPAEKDAVMEAFLRKEILILVSTTVVEVGVDVPNATVMMVENAECFGLAQLHQLRGRVGRGRERSYCILVDGSGRKEKNPRLKVLTESRDGFAIAEEDLRLRGPGDFFGLRQSGELHFRLGDIYSDADILYKASEEAGRLLASPDLKEGKEYAALREKLTAEKVIF